MLVWCDVETTGLDPRQDALLELACIVTDDALNDIARYERVIYAPVTASVVDGLEFFRQASPEGQKTLGAALGVNPYVIAIHDKNGLWRESMSNGLALDSVDREFKDFLDSFAVTREAYSDESGVEGATREVLPQLAGSTISFDRTFLAAHMPRAYKRLHYRSIDVSGFNETAKRFWRELYETRPTANKQASHRGMDDITESINVYKHYLANLSARAA